MPANSRQWQRNKSLRVKSSKVKKLQAAGDRSNGKGNYRQ